MERLTTSEYAELCNIIEKIDAITWDMEERTRREGRRLIAKEEIYEKLITATDLLKEAEIISTLIGTI